jgi:hypothetical protein
MTVFVPRNKALLPLNFQVSVPGRTSLVHVSFAAGSYETDDDALIETLRKDFQEFIMDKPSEKVRSNKPRVVTKEQEG